MSAFITIHLERDRWVLLEEWVTRPTEHTKHKDIGGMQKRRRDWIARMNAADHAITLTRETDPALMSVDDVTWIARTIFNQNAGGFQWRIARIFADTHPLFSGLPIKPRKPRNNNSKGKPDDVKPRPFI